MLNFILLLLCAGPQVNPTPEPTSPLGHTHLKQTAEVRILRHGEVFLFEMPVAWPGVQSLEPLKEGRGADGKTPELISTTLSEHRILATQSHFEGLVAVIPKVSEPSRVRIPADTRLVLVWNHETEEIRIQMGHYFQAPLAGESALRRPQRDGKRVSYTWKQTPDGSITTNAAGEVTARMTRSLGEPPPYFEAYSCFSPASVEDLDKIVQAGTGRLNLRAVVDPPLGTPSHLLRFQPFESLEKLQPSTVAESADGKFSYVWFD